MKGGRGMSIPYSALNSQQKEVISLAGDWIRDPFKQTFEISGPAGSGKTTIVRTILQLNGIDPSSVMYLAYVGKAAMMLSLNGNDGRTIHSAIYDLVQVPMLDADGAFIYKNGRMVTRFGFKLKECLPNWVKYIVIDEGSMVNEAIKKDLLSFGIPIIVLGDLNQLPPVFGNPAFLIKPDYVLTKIERQSENDPIVILSQRAIRGDYINFGSYGDKCHVIDRSKLSREDMKKTMTDMDIIICGKNQTRDNINNFYRTEIKGFRPDVPMVGDKIICRQNNWNLALDNGIHLINGLIGYLDNMYLDTFNKRSMYIDFRPEFLQEESFERIVMDFPYLFIPLHQANNQKRSYYNRFQFAYAITAHLSQGSQYGSVLVYDEVMGSRDYYMKWLYTCITRAMHTLYIWR
jgi:exodeoxyribonuclease-5